jgi:lipoate-protein ligase B
MEFEAIDLGLIDYRRAQDRQEEAFAAIKGQKGRSTLLLCRHHPVITLGRNASINNILVPEKELKKKGIGVFHAQRGGDVTYHGPGQLVAYPIFNLDDFRKDIYFFLRTLESAVIEFLAEFGVNAQRCSPLTGVWVDKEKISSIGIGIRNWITFHGVSINIKKDDLSNFNAIRPCGMDIQVTSLESCLGNNIEIDSVKENLINAFRKVFSDPQT